MNVQWGSEIRPFENRKHSKSGHFEGRISNGKKQDGYPKVRFSNGWDQNRPTYDHLKSGHVRFSDPHCTFIRIPNKP